MSNIFSTDDTSNRENTGWLAVYAVAVTTLDNAALQVQLIEKIQ